MPAERIYLDANILIYLIEGHSEYTPIVGKMLIDLEKRGGVPIISDLCRCECLIGPAKQGNQALVRRYEDAFNDATEFEFIDFMPSTLEQVPDLAAQCGLKILDAMHLSLALQAGCDGFATNDRGFESAETLIDIISLT